MITNEELDCLLKIPQKQVTKFCKKHDLPFVEIGEEYACPACHEEEAVIREHKRLERRMRNCRIEPMYHDATFESFEAWSEEQQKALAATQKLISSKSGKLIFTGKNGTGKTHLGCAAVRELKGEIWSMYEISTKIRASYTSPQGPDELAIVNRLASIPLLVIDEVGRTKGSDAETNWLSYIIDKRHVRRLPLILITNKHIRKACPEKGCGDCLENYIGNDIMSRFNEDGAVVNFTGEDYRRKRRNNE